MIRKHKSYSRPKKPFELTRIKAENVLLEKYGLKNKREIWKTIEKVNYFRHRAMEISKAPREEQEILFAKLRNLGLNVNSIADVLALTIEDILNRRLQTIIFKKKFALTVKQSRQFIVHRKVLVDNRVTNVPGYLVSVEEEKNLKTSVVPVQKKEKDNMERAIKGQEAGE